ncbi:MAG: hypothetical protein C0598_08530, partial [Marinilabiliales bacterium]
WVTNGETKINAKAIVGSDGASSIINRTFFKIQKDWRHKHLTVQAYFSNVGQIKSDTLEIFLNKEIIPGGIWIFPMKGEVCNVGMGMLVKTLRKNNTDIKTLFMDLIYKTKTLGGMFETAELTSDINVRVLPLGQRISKISKERILLLGDAISVVNPITGEGIGQAMNSGRIAALHLDKCLISNDFSKTKMKEYDKSIARKFNSVIRMSYGIQRLISFPFLSNRIANNYNKNLKLRKQIESLINDPANYSKIFDPRLYYRILVG